LGELGVLDSGECGWAAAFPPTPLFSGASISVTEKVPEREQEGRERERKWLAQFD